jgi:hypothetical protein
VNPFGLDVTGLLVWGAVAHLVADWLLQNEWMAVNKMKRLRRWDIMREQMGGTPLELPSRWWARHPAAYVHAGIHGLLLAPVFGWAAVPLAAAHFLIDLRTPVAWWSRLIRQTQPNFNRFDIGNDVRIWNDQVWHLACLAIAAVVVG